MTFGRVALYRKSLIYDEKSSYFQTSQVPDDIRPAIVNDTFCTDTHIVKFFASL